ncbi:helix-turn-helix transcriptional regulator [Streptococcus sp. Marseille-P7375]|uniref:helix-turn-helix transcriptional regulator n=1 Tax=Streptococcus sp. Marseille-P7375 TaxID=2487318 RepID=UPI000B3171D1|nr:AraC family transcriptional regulator [Streptococcus sp. Marseille-P7375]
MSKVIMEEVAAYLRQHADEELSLTDLAQHFHYSPSHLSRTFKKKMGFSIKQYMEALKMEKGIQEIVEGRQNVTETSMEAGYDSLGSFSNTFKRHTGLSPKKYHQESTKAYDFMVKQLEEKGALLHQDPDCKSGNRLTVALSYPEGYEPRLSCIGLFKTRIPKEEPVIGVALSQERQFTFENVPDGHYYLLACELLEDLRLTKNYVLKHNFRWGSDDPLAFSGDSIYQEEISMRRPLPSDPPITVNLPVLIMRSLAKQAQLRIRKFLS